MDPSINQLTNSQANSQIRRQQSEVRSEHGRAESLRYIATISQSLDCCDSSIWVDIFIFPFLMIVERPQAQGLLKSLGDNFDWLFIMPFVKPPAEDYVCTSY